MRNTPVPIPFLTKSTQDRLADQLSWQGDCLIWLGARTAGYGVIGIDAKTCRVGRVILALVIGDSDLIIRHSCRNRACVNPLHIQYGTARENVLDRKRDGTDNAGSRHGMSKLSEATVLKMFDLAPSHTGRDIAALFGVSEAVVSGILSSTRWVHVQACLTGKRFQSQMGGTHHSAVLTESDAVTIRSLAGQVSQRKLASQYGVSRRSVCDVIHRRTWKHI